ncbi:helix-turn-helix domain-containing protein [Lacticaseibacillus absianus]|uniref:helix-turn-helix domain-containing protein n=1 Tax=Lacticaseibacillus absianus TaxID=2729623 RepID=UPI0015CAB5D3|nr:helix-turn-helix transcriptional regulator [Lacticaseibacillus absianus]
MSTQTIGGFFRQFRKERGLSLEEACANTGCSPAALSRFERDQSDLSVANVTQLIGNLRLAAHDLLWFDASREDLLDISVYYAFLAGDTATLHTKAAAYTRTHPLKARWPLNGLVQLLFSVSQWPVTAPARQLSPQQEQQLQSILMPFPGWSYEVQTLTLAATLQFASHELMATITQQFIAYAESFTAATIGSSVITGTDYAHLLIHLLSHREFALADALLPVTRRYHQLRLDHRPVSPVVVYAINATPLIQFAQAAADWLRAPSPATTVAATRLIHQVHELGAQSLATYMQRMWAVIQPGVSSWHNPSLTPGVPIAFDPDNWQFNGSTLKAVRQYYHLSLAQTAVSWSAATQSRFENGLTQLGFNEARALAEALLLNPVIFYLDLYPLPVATLARMLANHTGPDRVANITAALADALETLPTQPQGYELLIKADLEARAIQLLQGEGLTPAALDQQIDRARVRHDALSGLYQLEHVQFSDLNTFLTITDVLGFPPDDMVNSWRWLFSHATFDLTKSQQATDLLTNMVITLAAHADVPHIRQLRHAVANLIHHPVWISYVATATLTEHLVALYMAPERAAVTWAALDRQRATMRQFACPSDPTGGWIGDENERVETTVRSVFDRWLQAHTD